MKSIFEIINSQSVPEEPTPQPQIQPEPVAQKPQPKLFMQQLIQHGKTDISTYVLKPQKSLTPAMLVKKHIADQIQHSSWKDIDDLTYWLSIAKQKRIILTKIQIPVKRNDSTYLFNPLEYVLYKFSDNPLKMSKIVKYLIANEPRFLDEYVLFNCMNSFLLFDMADGKTKLKNCNEEFLKTYKLLVDYGAKTPNITCILFEQNSFEQVAMRISQGEKMVCENYDLIELLLYSNNETINQKILDVFYTCDNPEFFYPVLERYGLKPDLNTAIASLKFVKGKPVLKYLVERGVFDKQDISEQRIRDAIVEHKVCGIVTASQVIYHAQEIRDGTKEEIEQRQREKLEQQQLQEKQKRKQEQKQQIQQVFEKAVQSIDENTK